jgi:hypothetical protein
MATWQRATYNYYQGLRASASLEAAAKEAAAELKRLRDEVAYYEPFIRLLFLIHSH